MTLAAKQIVGNLFPTRALALLLGIGFLDLTATAVLHANGMIVELNPLMRPLIERSEWLFALVKALTLFGAWFVMARHAKVNLKFVRATALAGSCVYMVVWVTWFFTGARPV
ncbi:MAG: hypothetical protein KF857_10445 [Fimbriimonadaceae bacterium]|nr:hypothetical protein [Fimbriimonadaceae bacterium]